MKVKRESEANQLCPTLRDPMDCSQPGCSIHGISQARVLEWVPIAFSKRSLVAVTTPKAQWIIKFCYAEISLWWTLTDKNISFFFFCHLLILFDAAAAAKSLQSCATLCNPIDGSPPGSPVPGILQARTLEWVAISFSIAWKWKVKVKSLSRVRLLATPWTAAYQASPSMGFSRQEYWSGVPLPSPELLLRVKLYFNSRVTLEREK